jgi:8-oxo-dGTP pyrophosphatase MutT (NUDIX family)
MGVPFVPKYVRPSIIVFDEDNRILLVRYCEDDRWDVPGGCMEVGESVEESARRELREETGLIAKTPTLLVS